MVVIKEVMMKVVSQRVFIFLSHPQTFRDDVNLKLLEERLLQQLKASEATTKERLGAIETNLNSRVDDLETSVALRLKQVDDRLRGCEEADAAASTTNSSYVKQLHEANKKTSAAVKNLQVESCLLFMSKSCNFCLQVGASLFYPPPPQQLD